jgi:rubrerythrin
MTMATVDNLKTAFAGESQANRKYTAFARKADAEGLKQIARLFRAIAAAETVHALAHFRAMGGVGTTLENLKVAQEGERYEFKEMYPPFLAESITDGHRAAELAFKYALAVEEGHYALYGDAIAAAGARQDLPAAKVYVCEVCGHTVVGSAPERCPICNALRSKYTEIE